MTQSLITAFTALDPETPDREDFIEARAAELATLLVQHMDNVRPEAVKNLSRALEGICRLEPDLARAIQNGRQEHQSPTNGV